MSALTSFTELAGRWFALIVVVAGAIALATPDTFAGAVVAVPWLRLVLSSSGRAVPDQR